MRVLLMACFLALPLPGQASELLIALRDSYIRPGFDRLQQESANLEAVSKEHCAPEDTELRTAFGSAWDAWIAVAHLRFGPTETDNRAFSLGFWPDTRGTVPKTLAAMIAAENPAVKDPAQFSEMSIAAHGFTALEFLLYDPALAAPSPYHCTLVQAVTTDIAKTSAAIAADWNGPYGAGYGAPGPDAPFASDLDALSKTYTAMLTGLEFNINARLGRPLGSFDRPRPTRAEARRAGRSLRHVQLSLASLHDLASILMLDLEGAEMVESAFITAREAAAALDDPVFAGVAAPQSRLRIEALQQDLKKIDELARLHASAGLGVSQGFNALDGD
ncbi:MAG: imelysin family protein [Mangrovicoccus sp.]|nr:imelysin family protein [Mangrovicoccus sp.]